MTIPWRTVLVIMKPLTPIVRKRAAGYAADYLNSRRLARSIPKDPLDVTPNIEPLQTTSEGKRSSGFMMLSGLLGAIIGAGLCFVITRRR